MDQLYPHTIFALAHTSVRVQPGNNKERTLRIVTQANLSAQAIRVEFSNRSGDSTTFIGAASVARCDEKGNLIPGTSVPVCLGGAADFSLSVGEVKQSDWVECPFSAGDHLALSIYYPENTPVTSGNWLGGFSSRSPHGNYTTAPCFDHKGLLYRLGKTVYGSDFTVALTTVSQIIAYSTNKQRVVACFGDSITQQGNWTAPLAKRLLHAYPGEITLCNLGISGNQLLTDSPPHKKELYGIAGIQRFEQDMLTLHGLTHAILMIGTNDLGLPGTLGQPAAPLITLEQYAGAMTSLANKLHQKGVLVYGATLLPRTINANFGPHKEQLRQTFNNWIRSASCFDAVIDFDSVARRKDGKPGLPDDWAFRDGLHPSPLGGMYLAQSIDLSLFGGPSL